MNEISFIIFYSICILFIFICIYYISVSKNCFKNNVFYKLLGIFITGALTFSYLLLNKVTEYKSVKNKINKEFIGSNNHPLLEELGISSKQQLSEIDKQWKDEIKESNDKISLIENNKKKIEDENYDILSYFQKISNTINNDNINKKLFDSTINDIIKQNYNYLIYQIIQQIQIQLTKQLTTNIDGYKNKVTSAKQGNRGDLMRFQNQYYSEGKKPENNKSKNAKSKESIYPENLDGIYDSKNFDLLLQGKNPINIFSKNAFIDIENGLKKHLGDMQIKMINITVITQNSQLIKDLTDIIQNDPIIDIPNNFILNELQQNTANLTNSDYNKKLKENKDTLETEIKDKIEKYLSNNAKINEDIKEIDNIKKTTQKEINDKYKLLNENILKENDKYEKCSECFNLIYEKLSKLVQELKESEQIALETSRKLESEQNILKSRIRELKQYNNDYVRELETKKNLNISLNEQIQKYRIDIESIELKNNDLERQISIKENELEKLLEDKNQDLLNYSSEKTILLDEIQTLKTEKINNNQQLLDLKRENSELTTRIETNRNNISSLKEQLLAINETNKSLLKQNTDLISDLNYFKSNEEKIENEKKKINEIKDEIYLLRKNNNTLTQEKNILVQENQDNLSKLKEELNAKYKELEDKYNSLEENYNINEQIRFDRIEYENKLQELQAKIDSNKENEKNIQYFQEKYNELNNKIDKKFKFLCSQRQNYIYEYTNLTNKYSEDLENFRSKIPEFIKISNLEKQLNPDINNKYVSQLSNQESNNYYDIQNKKKIISETNAEIQNDIVKSITQETIDDLQKEYNKLLDLEIKINTLLYQIETIDQIFIDIQYKCYKDEFEFDTSSQIYKFDRPYLNTSVNQLINDHYTLLQKVLLISERHNDFINQIPMREQIIKKSNEITKNLIQLTNDKSQLSDNITKLSNTIFEKDIQIKALNEELTSIKEQLSTINDIKNQQSKLEINKLTTEIGQLQSKINTLEKENETYSKSNITFIKLLNQKITKLIDNNLAINNDIIEEIKKLKEKNSTTINNENKQDYKIIFNNNIEFLSAKLLNINTLLLDLQNENDKLKLENTKLIKENTDLSQDNIYLKSQLEEIKKEITTYKTFNQESINIIITLNNQIQNLLESIIKNKQFIDSNKFKISENNQNYIEINNKLNSDINIITTLITDLKQQKDNNNYNFNINELFDSITSLNNKQIIPNINRFQNEIISNILTDYNENIIRLKQLEDQNSILISELDSTKQQNDKIKDELQRLKLEFDNQIKEYNPTIIVSFIKDLFKKFTNYNDLNINLDDIISIENFKKNLQENLKIIILKHDEIFNNIIEKYKKDLLNIKQDNDEKLDIIKRLEQKILENQEAKRKIENKVNEIKSEDPNLLSNLEKSNQEIIKLQSLISELTIENTRLNKELDTYKLSKQEIENELSKVQNINLELESRLQLNNTNNNKLEEIKKQLVQKEQELLNEIESKKSMVLKDDLIKSESKIAELKQVIQMTINEKDLIIQKMQELNTEKEQIILILNTQLTENTEKINKLNEIEQDKIKLEDEIKKIVLTKDTIIKEIQLENTENTENINKLNDKLTKIEQEKQLLESKSNNQSEIINLTEQLTKLKEEKQLLEQTNIQQNLENQQKITLLNKNLEQKNTDFIKINEDFKRIEQEKEQKDSEINTLSEQIKLKDSEINTLSEQIKLKDILSNNLKEKELEIISLKTNINDIISRQESFKKNIDELEQLKILSENKILTLETQLNEKDEIIKKYNNENKDNIIKELKLQLEQKVKEYSVLESKNKQKIIEKNNIYRDYLLIEEKNKEYIKRISELESLLEKNKPINEQIKMVEEELIQLKFTNKKLSEQNGIYKIQIEELLQKLHEINELNKILLSQKIELEGKISTMNIEQEKIINNKVKQITDEYKNKLNELEKTEWTVTQALKERDTAIELLKDHEITLSNLNNNNKIVKQQYQIDLQDKATTIAKYIIDLGILTAEKNQITEELKEIKSKTIYKEEHDKIVNDLTNLYKSEIETLKIDITAKQTIISENEQQINKLTKELQNHDEIVVRNSLLEEQIKELNKKNEDLNNEKESIIAELKKQINELQELDKSNKKLLSDNNKFINIVLTNLLINESNYTNEIKQYQYGLENISKLNTQIDTLTKLFNNNTFVLNNENILNVNNLINEYKKIIIDILYKNNQLNINNTELKRDSELLKLIQNKTNEETQNINNLNNKVLELLNLNIEIENENLNEINNYVGSYQSFIGGSIEEKELAYNNLENNIQLLTSKYERLYKINITLKEQNLILNNKIESNKQDYLKEILDLQTKYESRIQQLIIKKDQLNQNIQQLTTEKNQLNQNIQQLTTEKDQLNQNIQQLNTEKDQLNQNIQQLNTEKDQLNQTIQQLTIEIEEYKQQLQRLTNEYGQSSTDKDNIIRQLNQNIQQLIAEKDQLNIEKNQLNQTIQQLIGEKNQLNQTIQQLTNEIEQYKQQLQKLMNDHGQSSTDKDNIIKQLNQTIQQLTGEKDQLTIEKDQLNQRIQQLIGEKDQLNQTIQQLIDEKDQLNQTIQLLNTEKIQLTTERNQLTTEKDQLTIERNQLNQRIQELNIEHNQLNQRIQQLIIEKDQLNQLIQQLNIEKEQLNKENEKLRQIKDNEIMRLQNKYKKLKVQYDNVSQQIRTLGSKYRDILKKNTNLLEELKKLKEDLNNTNSVNNILLTEKNKLIIDKTNLINENTNLKLNLKTLEENYNQILEENQQLQIELKNAKDKVIYGEDIYYFIEKPKKDKSIINNFDLSINQKAKKLDKFGEYLLNNPRI